MEVREVLVRFFRSFNFDYLRKYHNRTNHFPWELMEDGSWYPFVRVPLAEGITTVVGANESGKSQILDALKIALLGEGVIRRDFCRYSKFFVVEETMRLPDFGVVINCLSEADRAALAPLCSLSRTRFRLNSP